MLRAMPGMVAAMMLLFLRDVPAGERSPVKCRLSETRHAVSDLEVGGELAGAPAGAIRYAAYEDLLKLPLATYTVSDDSNFGAHTQVTGVPLTQLALAVGALPQATLVAAICYDGYRANYPTSYLTAHRPMLVLKIDGKTEAGWPQSPHGGPLGPYLISHPAFTPSFQVLSHIDEQQIPFGVTRIEFRDPRTVLGGIAPQGSYAADLPVMQGYQIAQQNCFRCHNMGGEGGQMAGRSWGILAMWAATEPGYFKKYVKNPQSVDPKDRMPGNPGYDAATLEALRRYFATFAAAGSAGAYR